jgi:SET domain-containing protein
MEIFPPSKIYITKSNIHGYGVFAREKILEGEIIEECPILDLGMKYGESSTVLVDYRFNWPQGESKWEKQVVAWGYGSLYNHSNQANAYWRSNLEKGTFEFVCTKDIEIGEEILVYYGGDAYWQDGRTHTEVK